VTAHYEQASVYPHLEPGDEVTLDLVTGVTGLHGIVELVELDEQGTLRCLSVIDDQGRDPLRIRGDLVAIWRKGAPVRQVRPQLSVPIPAALGGNHRPG
jgi:hypothetical protein